MINKEHQSARKICVSLLCLTAILISPTLYAGDEDISPNAYNIFDPVTGYMVPADSQPTAQQGHAISEVGPNIASEPQDNQAENSTRPQSWIYLLAVMLLTAGYAAWKRNKNKISSSNSF